MLTWFQNRAFNLGFLIGFFLMVNINYFSQFSRPKINIIHDPHRIGFPFTAYEWDGYFQPASILWFGLTADIFIAVTFSFLLGIIFKFVWSKIRARKLK